MDETVRFSVSIPADLARAFDSRVEARGYVSRSEAVRDLMRDDLVDAEWEGDAAEVVGTATLIYDHSNPALEKALNRMQHSHRGEIICTTHVHLDDDACMEVVVLRGSAAAVRHVASALIAARGVKHGKLVCTSTGANLP
jgi:CopG family nickel-responsive transcriptional regulator